MSSSDLKTVEALLRLANKYKATRIKVGTVEVELSPLAWATPQALKELKAALDPSSGACPCGHEYSDHNETGCLHGCAIDKCAPEVAEEK